MGAIERQRRRARATGRTSTARLARVAPSSGATVSDLTCGTAYTFEVDAYDAAGNRSGRASLIGSTSACADTQPPTAPANVVATSRTSTSIALSWSASSDNVGVTGYGLYRGGAQTGTTAATTGIFSGLTCNTNYTLAVDAYDAAGNRSTKTVVMVSTTACPDTTPPSVPQGQRITGTTQSTIAMAWNASTDNVGVDRVRGLARRRQGYDDDRTDLHLCDLWRAGRPIRSVSSPTTLPGNKSNRATCKRACVDDGVFDAASASASASAAATAVVRLLEPMDRLATVGRVRGRRPPAPTSMHSHAATSTRPGTLPRPATSLP